jgi:hypothetical protein
MIVMALKKGPHIQHLKSYLLSKAVLLRFRFTFPRDDQPSVFSLCKPGES